MKTLIASSKSDKIVSIDGIDVPVCYSHYGYGGIYLSIEYGIVLSRVSLTPSLFL